MYPFRSLEDWVQHAGSIARFRVVAEERGPEHRSDLPDEPSTVDRYLRIEILEAYLGPIAPGSTFRIWSNEPWDLDLDGTLRPTSGAGCFRLEPGDEAIGALIGDGKDPARSALMTPEAVLLVRDGEIARTRRPDAVFDDLEGRPAAEVEAELRAAIAAARSGG